MSVRHNSPVRLPDSARRSEAKTPAVNAQRGGVDVIRVIAREIDGRLAVFSDEATRVKPSAIA